MQGDPEVLALLNEQLTSELTAVNQYFLHSKLQASWGFTELATHTRVESFEEMRHAEVILADEEQHIDYLQTQMELMDRLGEQLYLAQCVARPAC